MKPHDTFKLLDSIEQTDPSPFLLARIKARIRDAADVRLSTKAMVMVLAAFVLLLFANVGSFVLSKGVKKQAAAAVFEEITLNQSNQLYHD